MGNWLEIEVVSVNNWERPLWDSIFQVYRTICVITINRRLYKCSKLKIQGRQRFIWQLPILKERIIQKLFSYIRILPTAKYSWQAISMLLTDFGEGLCWWHCKSHQNGKRFTSINHYDFVTVMKSPTLSPRLHRCWWHILETKCVGDKFEMLVTDSGYWWPIWSIGKITNITKKVTNIMILPPTSEISHHHKVTNITMSPTSLSPVT